MCKLLTACWSYRRPCTRILGQFRAGSLGRRHYRNHRIRLSREKRRPSSPRLSSWRPVIMKTMNQRGGSACLAPTRNVQEVRVITYETADESEQDDHGQEVRAGSILHKDLLRIARRRALTLRGLRGGNDRSWGEFVEKQSWIIQAIISPWAPPWTTARPRSHSNPSLDSSDPLIPRRNRTLVVPDHTLANLPLCPMWRLWKHKSKIRLSVIGIAVFIKGSISADVEQLFVR